MWVKNKGTNECNKSTVRNDVVEKKNMGTIECDKSTVTPMLVLSNVMMNCQMWKKKNNGPTKSEKSTVISNVGITQCDDGIVKTWRKKIIVPPNVTKV